MFCCNVGSYRAAGCWKRISNMILDPSRSGQSQCNDGTDNDIRQCWQRCCHKWWQRWGQRCWQRMARFPIKLEFLIDFAEVHDEDLDEFLYFLDQCVIDDVAMLLFFMLMMVIMMLVAISCSNSNWLEWKVEAVKEQFGARILIPCCTHLQNILIITMVMMMMIYIGDPP